jgi:hypothetical protein
LVLLFVKRHCFLIWFNVFFFSLIFSQPFPQYPILLDHIEQHQFNTFPFLPNIQLDYINDNLIFDGSLPIAMSSYKIIDHLLPQLDDSLNGKGHSYFIYRQGDYLYRDFVLYKEMNLKDSINIKLVGQTRSFPGPYNNLGPQQSTSKNSLQNYHIKISNYYSTSSVFNIDYYYHRENIGLPIIDENNNQFSESNNVGLRYLYKKNKLYIKSQYNFQNGILNLQNYKLPYLTIWSNITIDYSFNDYYGLEIYYNNKLNHFELNSTVRKKRNQEISFGINSKFRNFNTQMGIKLIHITPTVFFNFNYKINGFELNTFYRSNKFYNIIKFDDLIQSSSNLIGFYGVDVKKESKLFSGNSTIELNYIGFKNQKKYSYLSSSIKYFQSNVSFSVNGFNSLNNSSNQYFINSKIEFIPVIIGDKLNQFRNIPILGMVLWEKQKRYKPFINFEINFTNWVKSGFNEIGNYNLIDLQNKQWWWNIGFGFDIQNFKFSWSQKYMSDEFIYFSDYGLIQPVRSISYFQIDWRFID